MPRAPAPPRRAPAYLLALVMAVALADHTAHAGNAFIIGHRADCSNEGEPVHLEKDWSSCFSCICKNGFVECRQEVCGPMEECAVVMPREGCCARCKGCWYNGTEHASHSEWSEKGSLMRCEAGVVTVSKPECYTPCEHPSSNRDTLFGCPVCNECVVNGQRVKEGRDVRISEEPCLSCRCFGGKLSCAKRACPVLPCPAAQRATPPGECCPRCMHPTADKILPGHGMTKPCIIGTEFHAHKNSFRLDPCTDCECKNGTAVCVRHTCPVLTCGERALPPPPGSCCPQCPRIEESKTACIAAGKTYLDGETWQLDACKSCECHGGEPRCAMERCLPLSCAPDQSPRRAPGQCCAKCVHSDGVCTVFGDPHYKTFDGKFYSFQGSCKYQLVSDCANGTFSIRISNDARNTTHSSWTRTATLRIGTFKVNLGKKMRVKVNGRRISFPYEANGVAHISKSNGSVLVKANVGVEMLWDGEGFLEVTVSSSYKSKLCGLCGNFNSVARDDMKMRDGKQTNDVWKFGSSWRVGGRRACSRQPERLGKTRCRGGRHHRARKLCRGFDHNQEFAACGAKLNPSNYKAACVRDSCGCTGTRCHCAAYRAYARECQRLGAEAHGWATAAWCDGAPPPWLLWSRGARGGGIKASSGFGLKAAVKPMTNGRARPPPPILH